MLRHVLCLMVLSAAPGISQDIDTFQKLDEAKSVHQLAMGNADSELTREIESKIREMASKVEFAVLERLIAERKDYVEAGELPTSEEFADAVSKYRDARFDAAKLLVGVFDTVAAEAASAGNVKSEAAIKDDRVQFLTEESRALGTRVRELEVQPFPPKGGEAKLTSPDVLRNVARVFDQQVDEINKLGTTAEKQTAYPKLEGKINESLKGQTWTWEMTITDVRLEEKTSKAFASISVPTGWEPFYKYRDENGSEINAFMRTFALDTAFLDANGLDALSIKKGDRLVVHGKPVAVIRYPEAITEFKDYVDGRWSCKSSKHLVIYLASPEVRFLRANAPKLAFATKNADGNAEPIKSNELTPNGGTVSVSATIGEFLTRLAEAGKGENDVQRAAIAKDAREWFHRNLRRSQVTLSFKIENLRKHDRGEYLVKASECETNLGANISLVRPEAFVVSLSDNKAPSVTPDSKFRLEIKGTIELETARGNAEEYGICLYFDKGAVVFLKEGWKARIIEIDQVPPKQE